MLFEALRNAPASFVILIKCHFHNGSHNNIQEKEWNESGTSNLFTCTHLCFIQLLNAGIVYGGGGKERVGTLRHSFLTIVKDKYTVVDLWQCDCIVKEIGLIMLYVRIGLYYEVWESSK